MATVLATSFSATDSAQADTLLGSYVARISDRDHQASDGYELSTAAQMVRQDRAYWHKFGSGDRDDEGDRWFRTNAQRERLQAMLERSRRDEPERPGAPSSMANRWCRSTSTQQRARQHSGALTGRQSSIAALPLIRSTGDLGEIRDLAGGRADARQQRQTVGAHGRVLIIHENVLEE